jgi:hypothetical protein
MNSFLFSSCSGCTCWCGSCTWKHSMVMTHTPIKYVQSFLGLQLANEKWYMPRNCVALGCISSCGQVDSTCHIGNHVRTRYPACATPRSSREQENRHRTFFISSHACQPTDVAPARTRDTSSAEAPDGKPVPNASASQGRNGHSFQPAAA